MTTGNLSHWIERRADWDGAKIAVRCAGREQSYAALDHGVRRLAAMLREGLGIEPGERVAHLGFNRPELLELLFACARIGAVLVPLNWRLAAAEHAWIIGDCGPRVLLGEPEFFDHVGGVGDAMSGVRRIGYGGDLSGGWLDYDELLGAAGDDAEAPGVDLSRAVMLVYTAGTTGRPKGAVLTQDNLFWNTINSIAAHDLTSADHVLTVLPMFHVGGMNIHTVPAIHAGATVTLQTRFDPGGALRLIEDERPTLFLAVPAVMQAMAGHPDWGTTDLSSLRLLGTGSSTIPAALLRAWLDRGIPANQIYGMTESGPVSIVLPAGDTRRKLGSCGKPVMHCEARIADDAGRTLPAGRSGEILLRGPALLREYWNNPEATAAAFSDGWFRTGDIGHTDDEGFFYVDDRKADMVISGGENIYPAELENVLADCPRIAEFAVVGRPDPDWGEVPVACIVPAAGAELTAADVLALFEGRLARYKHPRAVLFMESLPRNAMGKVLKYALRADLAKGR